MSDSKSLDEVVRQLEGESRQTARLSSVSADSTDAAEGSVDGLVEGLRATEWLLSDLRERCRQLHGYRLQLIDRLQQMEDGNYDEDFEDMLDGVVPGPASMQ